MFSSKDNKDLEGMGEDLKERIKLEITEFKIWK